MSFCSPSRASSTARRRSARRAPTTRRANEPDAARRVLPRPGPHPVVRSPDQIQRDLDAFITFYNFERTHQGTASVAARRPRPFTTSSPPSGSCQRFQPGPRRCRSPEDPPSPPRSGCRGNARLVHAGAARHPRNPGMITIAIRNVHRSPNLHASTPGLQSIGRYRPARTGATNQAFQR